MYKYEIDQYFTKWPNLTKIHPNEIFNIYILVYLIHNKWLVFKYSDKEMWYATINVMKYLIKK